MRLHHMLASVLLIAGTAFAAAPAEADSIRVTGTMTYDVANPPPQIELSSVERGFSLSARPDLSPFAPCAQADCTPGARLSISTGWIGSDLPGLASLDGSTFPVGGLTDEHGVAFVFFSSAFWTAPLFTGATNASVVTPLSLTGHIIPPSTDGQPRLAQLAGNGFATLRLTWNAPTEAWQLTRAEYQLTDQAPVPEPATVLLVVTGLAGVALRRRRQQRTHATGEAST